MASAATKENQPAIKARQAGIAFSKATGAIQVTVPQGAKLADVLKGLATLDKSALARLPRGCEACLSGHPFEIREIFEPVINVRLGQPG